MALIIAPILLVVLAFKELSGIRGLGLVGAGALLCAVLWVYSPYPRYLAFKAWDIIQTQPEHEQGWVGRRPGFWKRSLAFIAHAPIFGHGTGSIHKLFAGAASPGEPPLAWETTNALQQTFA